MVRRARLPKALEAVLELLHAHDGLVAGHLRTSESPGAPRRAVDLQVLSLEDPDAVLVRDQPTQSWVGDGNSGADELCEAVWKSTSASGAILH